MCGSGGRLVPVGAERLMPCFYGNFPGAGRQAQKDFLPAGGIFCTSREEYEKTPGEGDKKEAGFAIMNLSDEFTM